MWFCSILSLTLSSFQKRASGLMFHVSSLYLWTKLIKITQHNKTEAYQHTLCEWWAVVQACPSRPLQVELATLWSRTPCPGQGATACSWGNWLRGSPSSYLMSSCTQPEGKKAKEEGVEFSIVQNIRTDWNEENWSCSCCLEDFKFFKIPRTVYTRMTWVTGENRHINALTENLVRAHFFLGSSYSTSTFEIHSLILCVWEIPLECIQVFHAVM